MKAIFFAVLFCFSTLFAHEVVLITGASTGIGLATAEHLARCGYRVFATTRNPDSAKDLQALAQQLDSLTMKQRDVTSDDSVENTVAEIISEVGKIDALINNAGYGIFGPAETITIAEAQDLFAVNVFGLMRVTNAVLPHMRKEMKGRIINLSSVSGVIPSKNLPVYSASKFAVESLSASYAYNLSEWNIKIALIQPGPVLTNFTSTIDYGHRFKEEENPYLEILKDREDWDKMMASGQSSLDVAKVIQEALEAENPNLFYQTSQAVSDLLSKHYKDITGNSRIPRGLPIQNRK